MQSHLARKHLQKKRCHHVAAKQHGLESSETAREILKCCDGATTVRLIVDDLAKAYKAPREEIHEDVSVLLQDLADKGFIQL